MYQATQGVTMQTDLQQAITEYIDNVPQARMSPELAQIWRMCDKAGAAPEAPSVIAVQNALHEALANAHDNLPDVVADATFGADGVASCCADIAALAHLLAAPGGPGQPITNLAAYLS